MSATKLVSYVASAHGVSKARARAIVKGMFEFIAQEVMDRRQKVFVANFGTFRLRKTKVRTIRAYTTLGLAPRVLPAQERIGFKAAPAAKRISSVPDFEVRHG